MGSVRGPKMRRNIIFSREKAASAASVGTVLLVVIAVALTSVIGVFVFGLVKLPEESPKLDVVYTDLNDRWSVHINGVSQESPFNEFRVVAKKANGDYALYDDDRDATADALLVVGLEDLVSSSGGGTQNLPLVFVDVDADGRVSSGDLLLVHSTFIPANSLFMDSTRGFKTVGMAPHGIPLGSNLAIAASAETLPTSNIAPGDEVNLTIKHGSTVEATREGYVGASGDFIVDVYLEPTWHNGNHKAEFVVREGEVDEWSDIYMFKALAPDPPTPEEEEQYEALKHPLGTGDIIQVFHTPSNTVVLEFRL